MWRSSHVQSPNQRLHHTVCSLIQQSTLPTPIQTSHYTLHELEVISQLRDLHDVRWVGGHVGALKGHLELAEGPVDVVLAPHVGLRLWLVHLQVDLQLKWNT